MSSEDDHAEDEIRSSGEPVSERHFRFLKKPLRLRAFDAGKAAADVLAAIRAGRSPDSGTG
jgi:hypothetical protein